MTKDFIRRFPRSRAVGACLAFALLLMAGGSVGVEARQKPSGGAGALTDPPPLSSMAAPETPQQLLELKHAVQRLPLAALLSAVLALRPRRRGAPKRSLAVIQTQIILAVIGALVMLVVGSSLARAFGIVGAAGLVRYRAKVEDPKDAGVMLSTLAVGLASGVGLWLLAIFGCIFMLIMLGVLESFEPAAMRTFNLRIKAKDPAAFKPKVEEFLTREKTVFEVRAQTPEELHYEVCLPFDQTTDELSERIIAMDNSDDTEVEITDAKKAKK
ncbi:MAG TPA: MgtC/SapB family protein [Vicinamibacterales bacterium]|nr:MgtC/SapB family protein [Vicinamibacterales bacterium]